MKDHKGPKSFTQIYRHSILLKSAAFILILIYYFFAIPHTAFAKNSVSIHPNTAHKTVHVGFFHFEGYHNMDNSGEKSGYGYDFLQMISGYANFKYIYVGYQKNWNDMLDMLSAGKIDMLTYAPKISKYESRFDYSEHSIGSTSAVLTTTSSNARFAKNDYKSFNGMRVGFIRGTDRQDDFAKYAEKKGIKYKSVYFSTMSGMKAALEKGRKIDAMVADDLRVMTDEIIIDKFAQRELYVIVRKGNSKLLNTIDESIRKLNAADPSWQVELQSKYFLSGYSTKTPITLSESEYVRKLKASGKTLKVLYNPERYPLCYNENGKARGILIDIFKKIASDYGLPYKFAKTDTVAAYYKARQKVDADIVLDFAESSDDAEVLGYRLTSNYAESNYSLVTSDNFTGTAKTAAIINGSTAFDDIAMNYNPRIKITYYDTFDDCIDAVKSGDADCTFMYAVTAQMYILEDNNDRIKARQMNDVTFQFRLAVNSDTNMLLYGMLNKATHNLTSSYVEGVFNSYLLKAKQSYSLWDLIVSNPFVSLAVLLIILAVLLAFIVSLKRNAVKLKESDAAKTKFLSQMSHDIRTPLNGIIGMTQVAQKNVNDPVRTTDALEKISRSSDHLLTLINDILDLNRIESGKVIMAHEPTDIRIAVDQCIEVLKSSVINRDLKVVTEVSEIKYPYVFTDALHVRQILINLISNAVKFTPDGGTITFRMDAHPDDEGKTLMSRFEVADTGIGMSREFKEHIFEAFVQADDFNNRVLNKGSGLGMAIVRQYVDMLHGNIEIDSEPGRGTRLIVTLPFEIDGSASLTDAAAVDNENMKRDFTGVHILLAEDNDINVEVARAILEGSGITVEVAEDGTAALEKFKNSAPDEYQCILMDIMMPNMNGYEATEAIRKLDRADAEKIPIIAMTANAFAEDIKKAMDCGMDAHVAKPVDADMLIKTLAEFINRQQKK